MPNRRAIFLSAVTRSFTMSQFQVATSLAIKMDCRRCVASSNACSVRFWDIGLARGARLALQGARRVLRMMANKQIITSRKGAPRATPHSERGRSGAEKRDEFLRRIKSEYDRMLRHGAPTQSFAK